MKIRTNMLFNKVIVIFMFIITFHTLHRPLRSDIIFSESKTQSDKRKQNQTNHVTIYLF